MRTRLAALACVGLLAGSCGSDSDTGDSIGESATTSAADSVTTDPFDGGDGTNGESPTSSPDSVPALTTRDLPANPLPISFTREESAATTAVIDETGGTLEAQDASGVTYQLVIPAGALPDGQSITMTPIEVAESAIDDMAVSAVAFEPDGLVLFEPATLVIEKPADQPDGAAAFVTDGGGEDFRLKVASLGRTTTISVPHFSETGVAEATTAEVDNIRDNYRPSDREGRFQQEIETIVGRVTDPAARVEALTGIFVDWFDELAEAADRADMPNEVDELFGELLAAVDELEQVEALLETTLSGVGTAIVEAGVAMQAAILTMFDQAHLRCIENKDVNEIFQMLRWGTLHLYLFEPMAISPDNFVDDFRQAIDACATFEVEFRSTAAADETDGGFTAQVSATIPLNFEIGSGDLFVSRRSFKSSEVRAVLGGEGSTSSPAGDSSCSSSAEIAVVLDFSLSYPEGGAISDVRVSDTTLLIRFPEKVTWTCAFAQATIDLGESLWTPWFISLEGSRMLDGGVFDFPLPRENGDRYQNDKRIVDETVRDGVVSVSVEITVEHTPQVR